MGHRLIVIDFWTSCLTLICFVEKDHAFFQIIGKLRVAVVSSSITNSLEFPLHDGGAGATPSASTVRVTELLISIVGSEIIIE